MWFAIIGVFIIWAARAEEQETRLRADLSGRRAGTLATPIPGGPLEVESHLQDLDPELLVGENTDLGELVERPAFLRARRAVVRRSDGSIGIVSLDDVEELARAVELVAQPAERSDDVRTREHPNISMSPRAARMRRKRRLPSVM